jgi:phosphonate transport system permease protein
LALILLKGFGINALTCVLTIGIHSIGMLGKLFSEAIDNMDKSPLEALDAVGANSMQKIRYGIIPQIIPNLSSISLYRLDINVRSATVLGLIGTSAGGYGALLLLASSMWQWDILATVMVAIIVLVLSVDAISSYLRKKLV